MLVTDQVSKQFGGMAVLNRVSISVEPGEIVGLVGPNGSGKTTLLNCLSGFLAPDEGTIRFGDIRLDRMPAWKISRLGVRRTFQLASQPLKMTVLEAMLCGAPLPVGASVLGLLRTKRRKAEEREAIDRARELLDMLKLSHLMHQPAGQLSGGQQKLLSIGTALMDKPSVLLLDEPTAGVNPTLRLGLVERLKEVHKAGTSLLIIEHDMDFIARLCHRVYVLDRGEVIANCHPSELKDNARVVEAYLGAPKTTAVAEGE